MRGDILAVMPIDSEKVLSLMREKTYRPLLMKELMRELGLDKQERQALKRIMRQLRVDGEIVKIRGNRYGLPEKMNLVVGKISVHPDGYGFVMPEREGEPDLYVGARGLSGAMHGDKVVARVERVKGPGRQEGTVIRVLERALSRVIGRYQHARGSSVVIPSNTRLPFDFFVPPKSDGGAVDGDLVSAEIVRYPEAYKSPEARVVKVLGKAGDPGLDTDIAIEEHGLSTRFSAAAKKEAAAVPRKVTPAMRRGRRDLRALRTVTIDGERARDFDDAVGVEGLPGGAVRLYVSIADVAHYVTENSGIDMDAHARATSVYFPDRVLPMLPEELSNGVCSLNPDEDRLALTAEMEFDDKGGRLSYNVYESVIKSDMRMTYTDVAAIIERGDEETAARYDFLVDDFMLMKKLASRLNKVRRKRGSIDFDLPEPEVILDVQGRATSIIKAERNLAHRLIEEFMLAANETVAGHLEKNGVPFLYRIHEEPDEEKLAEMAELVKSFGLSWPASGSVRPKHLSQVLEKVEGRPEERFINTLMLRSMKQARYSPENAGHFGLASACYCHFTSPIRRYPDLQVHRALKELIRKGAAGASRKTQLAAPLPALGQHTSFMEREAEDAEREVVLMKKLRFMQNLVGEEFAGFITGVTAFGFFVELKDYFVEGLVRLTSLYDDYYTYEEKRHALVGERTRRVFRLGDEVEILVARVDMERRQIDFALAGAPRPSFPGKPGGKPGGKPAGRGKKEPVWVKYKKRGRKRR